MKLGLSKVGLTPGHRPGCGAGVLEACPALEDPWERDPTSSLCPEEGAKRGQWEGCLGALRASLWV